MGFRYSESGEGKWNLDLGAIEPALSLREVSTESAEILLPCFEDAGGDGQRAPPRRARPGGGRPAGHHRLRPMLAQYGVGRDGLPGDWAAGYDDAATPYTPAWQEEITSVPAQACIRVAREFARNAEQSKGRSMIIMGAGICQWFHGDTTYRAVLALVMLTGCMGRNGGGWAHYVGQEKTRPITGWLSLANALDWSRPPRTMIGTGYWYMHTDQWRQDGYCADALKLPALHRGPGRHAHRGRHGPVRPARLDAVLPAVRPEPAGPRGRGRGGRRRRQSDGRRRLHRRRRWRRHTEPADRGRGRPGELAADADAVALQPVRLLGQGQRVLPEEPAGHPQQRDGPRTDAERAPAEGSEVAGGGAGGQAGPAGVAPTSG